MDWEIYANVKQIMDENIWLDCYIGFIAAPIFINNFPNVDSGLEDIKNISLYTFKEKLKHNRKIE